MADTITLLDFANGDTDYVARMDANNAALRDKINALLAANGGSTGTLLSMAALLLGLFGGGVVRLGTDALTYAIVGETLVIAFGYAWRGASARVLTCLGATVDFSGKAAGTWYVELADDASLAIVASSASPLYEVVWTGSAFGAIALVAQTFFSSADETAELFSVVKNVLFASLEARLEGIESELLSGDDSGSANTYILSGPQIVGYAKYQIFVFAAAHANTGVSTLNVNGVGATAIKKMSSGSLVDLASGDISAGQVVVAIYDGTRFQLLGGVGGGGGGGTGDVTGPGSSTDSDFVQFDGATGKVIKDGGLALDTDGTLAANSDSRIPSQKAVKTALAVKVTGPSSAVDSNIAVFDGTTGKLVKDGGSAIALLKKGCAVFTFDGNGSTPATTNPAFIPVPYGFTITSWELVADVSSSTASASITVSKAAYSAWPTLTAIDGGSHPALSSAIKNSDSTLSGWTTSGAAGDYLYANLTSASNCSKLVLTLYLTRN